MRKGKIMKMMKDHSMSLIFSVLSRTTINSKDLPNEKPIFNEDNDDDMMKYDEDNDDDMVIMLC